MYFKVMLSLLELFLFPMVSIFAAAWQPCDMEFGKSIYRAIEQYLLLIKYRGIRIDVNLCWIKQITSP